MPRPETEQRRGGRRFKELSTPALLGHVLEEARRMVRAEVLHARRELQVELAQARKSGALLGAAGVLALCGLSALFVALGMALAEPASRGVAWVAMGQLAASVGLALLGLRAAPRRPLGRTRARLKGDADDVREWFPWA